MVKAVENAESSGRTYGGLTAEQRTAARRERLLDAGLEVFGTEGYRAASVRGVIRMSGLGERYFYENFSDLDELLVAVAERIHEEVMAETLVAVAGAGSDPIDQVSAGLGAFVRSITRDPRKARIKLLEMSGAGEVVQSRRREGMRTIADLIALRAPQIADDRGLDPRVISLGLVGAVNELMIDWFTGGGSAAEIDGLVEHCTVLFEGVMRLANQPEEK
ncbi:MAG: TetR/AcrR family transcriptional regulator [Solirubrobacterales bacterium]